MKSAILTTIATLVLFLISLIYAAICWVIIQMVYDGMISRALEIDREPAEGLEQWKIRYLFDWFIENIVACALIVAIGVIVGCAWRILYGDIRACVSRRRQR